MSQHTYCNPRLYIEDVGIIEDISGQVAFPGSNQISSLKVKIPGINQPEAAMLNKEVKFYLNYGSEDCVPYFVGYIKTFKSTETSAEIQAFDSRCFLGGEYAEEIMITDEDNYDGYTLGQFLFKHINDNLNTSEKTYLDLSLFNDTNPPVTMKGFRGEETPYSMALKLIKEAVDDTDIFDQYDYEMGVVFSERGASLKFIKQQPLDIGGPSFSYGDGIQTYNYKKMKLANKTTIGPVTVDLYSSNTPRVSKKLTDAPNMVKNTANKVNDVSAAFLAKEGLKALLHSRKEKYTIDLVATKGHYLQLGSIIHLNVDEEFKGNHRITSKNISFSTKGVALKLSLNTRPFDMTYN